MTRTPQDNSNSRGSAKLLTKLSRNDREQAIQACRKLTHGIDKGLDLTGEIKALLAQHTGEVVLTFTRNTLDAFALCMIGPGSEGGEKICYVKFAAARGGCGCGRAF